MRKKTTFMISGGKLRELRQKKFLTQMKLAQLIGMSPARIHQIEAVASSGIYAKSLISMAAVFEVTEDELLEKIGIKSDFPGELNPKDIIPVPDVPTFNLRVSAGPWQEVGEIAELHSDAQIDDGRFRIFAGGDSMEPEYPNGCLIEFKIVRWNIDELEVGRDYYVQAGDLATFKRLAKIEDDTLTFRAVNRKKYPDAFPAIRDNVVRMARAEYTLNVLKPGKIK